MRKWFHFGLFASNYGFFPTKTSVAIFLPRRWVTRELFAFLQWKEEASYTASLSGFLYPLMLLFASERSLTLHEALNSDELGKQGQDQGKSPNYVHGSTPEGGLGLGLAVGIHPTIGCSVKDVVAGLPHGLERSG